MSARSSHITYTDAGGNFKTHSVEHPIYYHDQSFLPSFGGKGDSHSSSHASLSGLNRPRPSSDNLNSLGEHGTSDHSEPSHSSSSSKHHHSSHHAHRFNPGLHQFPFAFTIPGSLPASIRTNSGMSMINYQLKASPVSPYPMPLIHVCTESPSNTMKPSICAT